MKRMKVLAEENVRLERLITNLSLDKEMLQDVIRRKSRARSSPGDHRLFAAELPGQRTASLRRVVEHIVLNTLVNHCI